MDEAVAVASRQGIYAIIFVRYSPGLDKNIVSFQATLHRIPMRSSLDLFLWIRPFYSCLLSDLAFEWQ